jgi:RNA polymerase sigma factor (sigma-70 family)
MTPDNELLRLYADSRSEDAFAELVKRHVNLIYSAALRQVGGDAHLAQDVAQTVFTDLARKAASLTRRETITGWLYTSTHFAAAKVARGESRRRDREERFMREPIHDTSPSADWENLRPILDSAMQGLKETDREAVLLRYFENRPYAEVGAKLGVNENTARMRVERALEKLRVLLAQRALTTSAGLASIISANAVQVAPPALAAAVTNTSLAAAGAGTSFALFKVMTLTQLKVGLGAIAVAGAATTMVLQHQTQRQLASDNASLSQEIAQLKMDSANTPNLAGTSNNSFSNEQLSELLKLRGEVTALRSQTNQLAKLRDENQKMHEAFTRLAQQNQPPADQDAAKQKEFGITEMNISRQIVVGMIMYASEHESQFPTNFDQASSYLRDSGDATNLSRFEMVYTGPYSNIANPSSAILVRETQPWMSGEKWLRTYGFVDGHSEVHNFGSDANFDDWEQQHAVVLKNQ